MRKILAVGGFVLTSLLVSGSAFAQGAPPPPNYGYGYGYGQPAPPAARYEEEKKIGLGGDLLFLAPLGDFGDATGPLLGPVLRGGYRVIPELEVTGRLGYLFGFSKSEAGVDSSVGVIPIWAGARYFFMEPYAGVYAGGEIGLNILRASLSTPFGDVSDSSTRFGFNLTAGYVISKELPIDLRLQFSHLNLLGQDTGESAALGIGASVGYTFQL